MTLDDIVSGQFFNCSLLIPVPMGVSAFAPKRMFLSIASLLWQIMVSFNNGVQVGREYIILNSAIFVPFLFVCRGTLHTK